MGLRRAAFLLGVADLLGGLSVSGRLRPTSVSGFPLAGLTIRLPYDTAFPQPDPDGPLTFVPLLATHPPLLVDPGRPSGLSPN